MVDGRTIQRIDPRLLAEAIRANRPVLGSLTSSLGSRSRVVHPRL
jgi:hypothetical protein